MEFQYWEPDDNDNLVDAHRRMLANQIGERYYLRETVNPFAVSTTEFVKLFRMPQHKVRTLVDILRPYCNVAVNRRSIPFEIKVLTALSFYATGSYQRIVGRSADSNTCQSKVSGIVTEITNALNHGDVLRRFIRFPVTPQEREMAIHRNARLGMPRVIGLLDGTFVRIVPPPRNMPRETYFCRKGYAALNCQVICDANLRILNINAQFPGACTDAFVWRSCGVCDAMQQAYAESRCWLLADSGYAHEPWVQIPIPHAEPGTPEFSYTLLHCHARNAVERCIGVLKGRWRCLLSDRALHYSPVKAGLIVNACAVLHNFCLDENIPNPIPLLHRDHGAGVVDFFDDGFELAVQAEEERQILINYAHARRLNEAY